MHPDTTQAGGDQQQVLEAYDSALAASASRVDEAQSAAARLACQVTEMELQIQQLTLICNGGGAAVIASSAAAAGAGGVGAIGNSSNNNAGGCSPITRAVMASPRGNRSPERLRSPCRNAFAAGAAPDSCGGRGVRALRQHQTHLEQQLAKQNGELSQLQRDNIKLLRYKKQWEVAAQGLQASAGSKAAAEAFAQEAGLRAAAAAGRADRLELQVRFPCTRTVRMSVCCGWSVYYVNECVVCLFWPRSHCGRGG